MDVRTRIGAFSIFVHRRHHRRRHHCKPRPREFYFDEIERARFFRSLPIRWCNRKCVCRVIWYFIADTYPHVSYSPMCERHGYTANSRYSCVHDSSVKLKSSRHKKENRWKRKNKQFTNAICYRMSVITKKYVPVKSNRARSFILMKFLRWNFLCIAFVRTLVITMY